MTERVQPLENGLTGDFMRPRDIKIRVGWIGWAEKNIDTLT